MHFGEFDCCSELDIVGFDISGLHYDATMLEKLGFPRFHLFCELLNHSFYRDIHFFEDVRKLYAYSVQ